MDLKDYRVRIDAIDDQILALFKERMEVSLGIAECKKAQGLPTENPQREAEILEKRRAQAGEELAPYAEALFRCLFTQSKALQDTKR